MNIYQSKNRNELLSLLEMEQKQRNCLLEAYNFLISDNNQLVAINNALIDFLIKNGFDLNKVISPSILKEYKQHRVQSINNAKGSFTLKAMQLHQEMAGQSARSETGRKAGKSRAKSDKKVKNMEMVKQEYLKKWEEGYRFPQGTLNVFYSEMAEKYDLDFSSIKNRIGMYRKELEHTKTKKQPS